MSKSLDSTPKIIQKRISGWGRKNFVKSKLVYIEDLSEFYKIFSKAKDKAFIPRGMGRCYGDAAQLKNNYVINLNFSKEISISGNQLTVDAGVSIEEILKVILPLGYFLPVSPGSSKITIGGAIAADVHGKNHHKNGSIGNHITKIIIVDGKGEIRELKPEFEKNSENKDYFWATIGGMGLTGIILQATINLQKVETSYMKVDTFICNKLDLLLDLMRRKDKEYSYTVAWIDNFNKNFRGVLTCGEHALKKDLNLIGQDYLLYNSNQFLSTPNFLPDRLLNKFTMKSFNELWFQKSRMKKNSIQNISQFFHPLDKVKNWNRIYGSQGFYQYQFVVPDKETFFISETLEKLKKLSANSFLTVLKRFGNRNNAFLSFPEPGWTLTLDLPAYNKDILEILEDLDQKLACLRGKIYLAKDIRQSSEIFKKTYKLYPKWRSIKYKLDPNNIFQSDLSRRLGI